MPKDAKKFINPLLRPSQDSDSKLDFTSDVKPAKAVSPVTPPSVALPAAQSLIVSEDVAVSPTSSVALSVDPAPSATNETEIAPLSSDVSVPLYKSTSAALDTLSSTRDDFIDPDEQPIVPSRASTSRDETLPPLSVDAIENQPARETSVSSSSHKMGNLDMLATSSSPTPRPRTSRRAQETPSYADSPTMYESSGRKSAGQTLPSSYESVRKQKLEHHVASERARHKRGELAFEQTHERITLWVNKSLKQAFEDLAYEQDFSKTSLLNEAIADLLKKYEVH